MVQFKADPGAFPQSSAASTVYSTLEMIERKSSKTKTEKLEGDSRSDDDYIKSIVCCK